MTSSAMCRTSATLVLTAWLAVGGAAGCSEGNRSGAATSKASTVEVTYYYLPG